MSRLRDNPRRIRRSDVRPSSDIDRCYFVSVLGIAARLTDKLRLRPAVALIAMSTPATRATGISRVNFDKRDTSEAALVLEKTFEFVKRPASQVITRRFFNPYPLGDARQVFNGNPKTVVFSGGNNGLAYNVVRVLGKTGFLARKFSQLPLRAFRTALLQALAKSAVLTAHPLDLCATVGRAEGVRSEFGNSEVNTQIALNIFGRWLRYFACCQQVELSAGIHKVGLALLKAEPLELTRSRREKHFLPAFECPDGHAKGAEFPLEDTGIVGNRAVWPKGALGVLIQLVRVSDLGFNTNSHLACQPVLFPDGVVGQFVKAELPKRLSIPRYLRHVVRRLIRPFKGFKEHPMLFKTRKKLDLRRQFHTPILPIFQGVEQVETDLRGSQFLCRLKAGSLLAALR